jgi:hypothetical protein
MAEVLWSPPGPRDEPDFLRRTAAHLERLKQAGVSVCQGEEK